MGTGVHWAWVQIPSPPFANCVASGQTLTFCGCFADATGWYKENPRQIKSSPSMVVAALVFVVISSTGVMTTAGRHW